MKRTLSVAGLVLGLAFLVPPAQAQSTGAARGKVLDKEGKPLQDVVVTIEFTGGIPRKFDVRTNKKGEYMQVGLAPGPYRFTATKEGYQPAFIDARVGLGEATTIPDFTLNTMAQAAQEPGSDAAKLREEFQKAVALTNAGDLAAAEAAYKALLEKNPDVPEIHQNLGYIYAQKKDYAAAEAEYLKGLELRPDSSDMAAALAKVYQDSGQPEKAMELMQKQAGENPADARAQFNQGVFLLNAGKAPEAIKAFEAAIAADPAMAEAYYHLGTLMVGQGKIPEAIQNLEKYLSMDPANAQNKATAQGLLQALKK
jgi:tetratricopeptide (TPR) repeat protein